jgi:GT2 family glycosyltransferase
MLKSLPVSIVIPSYERGDILCKTVEMALRQDYDDFEVIVVDQSSGVPEPMERLIAVADGRLKYLRLSTPNLPAARNAGVKSARGEIIVFIDDDVVIESDFVTAYARLFLDPAVGGAMGLTSTPRIPQPSIEGILQRVGAKKRFPDGTVQVFWLEGCNCAYRKTALVEAGLSDERYTGSAWSEDADLAVRVGHAGYKLVFDPSVRLTHLEIASGGCANRAPDASDRRSDAAERKTEERYRLYLFFCIKNRAIFGPREFLRYVWSYYRLNLFNRSSFRNWQQIPRKQFLFFRSLRNAARMCNTAAPIHPEQRIAENA